MAGVQHLLRKAALEKMSSPEQLDMAMRVTSPVGWISLAALGGLTVVALIFGIVGRVPVKVDASGILLRGEKVGTVEASANGVVEKLNVQEGSIVEKGHIVAHLKLLEVESEIRASEDRIRDLQGQKEARDNQIAILRSSYQQQLDNLYHRRRNVERLVEKQIKTRNDLAEIDAQISSVRSQMVQAGEGETQRLNELAEEQRRLKQLTERLKNGAEVRSTQSGRVAAILKQEGQVVQQGERLLNIEDPKAPFHVLLFVPFSEGKKILPKQVVRISPSTVRPEEYGFMLGTIETVSSQPVTPEEVRATLNNDQLAHRFAQDTPFRVKAVPRLDPSNSDRFVWTSSGGPPQVIVANTPCTAQIIIDERSPISYVIPALKKAAGVGN